jgi:phosphatidylglycerol---prolipoprotein diacylglyceryl transferase
MVIGLDPIWLRLGPFALRPLGLFALIGLGFGIWLTLRRAPNDREAVLTALAWAIPVGVLTAHVVHVLGWWDYYLTRPADIWQLGIDTLSLWGGLVGGGVIASASLRTGPRLRARVFDAAAPGVALGIGVGRLGEFLEGAGQGLPSGLPWATRYSSPFAATPDFGVPRHPAQLYDFVIALALAGLLLALDRKLPVGFLGALFFVAYAAARVVLGLVRLDPPFLFGLQIEQLLALGTTVYLAVIGLRLLRSRLQVHDRPSARAPVPAGAVEPPRRP